MHDISTYLEKLIVQNRDFTYKHTIDDTTFKEYNISLINIDVYFKESTYKTQPLLIGNHEDLKKLSIDLWNQCTKDWINNSIENNSCYSLKNNLLVPEMTKLVTKNLGKVLDVGSYNGEILYLINKTKDINIKEYIGVDLINQESITLYPLANNQKYIQQDIFKYAETKEKFDTIFLSMTLLNIIDIDKVLIKLLNLINVNGSLYIADINSEAYQAKGFYYKDNNEWYLKQIFKEDQVFFTLKKLSKNFHTIHCHHPINLYRNILEQNNMHIIDDIVIGPQKNEIIQYCKNSEYRNKVIKKMAKYMKYPCFHLIKAKKITNQRRPIKKPKTDF